MSLEQIHQVILDQLMILDHSNDVPGMPLLQGLFELAYKSRSTSGEAGKREEKYNLLLLVYCSRVNA